MPLTLLSNHRLCLFPLALVVAGCSSGSDDTAGPPDAAKDTSTADVSMQDSSGGQEAGTSDGATDTGSNDTGTPDASDGGCSTAWLTPPAVDPSLSVPADGGGVLAHGAGSGTQNYACVLTDAGSGARTIVVDVSCAATAENVTPTGFAAEVLDSVTNSWLWREDAGKLKLTFVVNEPDD